MATLEKTVPLIAAMLVMALSGSAFAAPLSAKTDPDALPGGVAAKGNSIAEAWLIAPTDRYDHNVHANRVEAGGVRARLPDGQVLSLMLPDTEVFEDSIVRLADLDGDGADEIVLVLSSLRKGASLAVLEVSDAGITIAAQTPFIGQTHRWLNPAGIADFTGDGHLEVALVQMPHLWKRLELWRLVQGTLQRVAAVDDVSNHRIGTPQQSLAVTADFDGDGIADLAIPDGARSAIRLLRFAGGAQEIARIPLPGDAVSDLRQSGPGTLSVELSDGRRTTISR
ncbi:FG-GAP repeat domain-containing protein [Devosia sp.]|uniref:FG-GAP repeat domain-containing protein n=1 Tax=Devosia sp. TaxID=1871048 RepID=UPI003A8DF033